MPYFTMAGNAVKSLFIKPATRLYPIQKRQPFAISRGHISINIEICIFCGICQKKCPTDAISVARKEKAWEIERLKCIACGCCVDSCPKDCLSMDNLYLSPVSMDEKDNTRNRFNGNKSDQSDHAEEKDV